MTVTAHDRQCIQQAAILGRRLDIHQVEQSEQQGAVPGVDWPQQRQLVTVVPRRNGFVLFRQCRNATLLRQKLSDVTPEYGVRVLCLFGFQYLAEDADEIFLNRAVLVMEGIELLFGCRLCPPNAAQHHLDQFVAAVHAGVAQQGQQQGVPLARLGDVEEILDLQRRASAANWRSLVWAIPSSSGSGSISWASQSSRSIQSLIVVGVAGPGVCFRRLKLVVVLFVGLTNRASSVAGVPAVTSHGHTIVNATHGPRRAADSPGGREC